MDKREATELLQTYRPGASDSQEPRMAEALQWTDRDPELAQWFESHCLLSTTMRARLREIPVPADLKEKILLAESERRGVIVWLRNMLVPLAAAAVVLLLAAAAWMLFAPADKFADARERLVKVPQRSYAMTMTSTNLVAIHNFLLANQCPDYVLPKPLAKLAGKGCANLEWRSRKVSMVCLKDTKNRDLYLFVMNDGNLKDGPATASPEFAPVLHLMSASWAQDGKLYILAGNGDASELKQYLE